MKVFVGTLLALFIFSASAAYGQKFLKKPYTEWGMTDAMNLVSNSPWAKTYTSGESSASAESQSIARAQRDTVNSGGGNPGSKSWNLGNLPVVIRLHSNRYVREGIVRVQQLKAKYDKMSEAEKADFDASRKGFLDCPICKNYYVVTLTKFTDASGESTNEGIFESMTLEDMKGFITLENEKGEKRELVQFTPPKGGGDSAIFFFKRMDDSGKPLISAENKELTFVFANDFILKDKRYSALYPRRFEFSVSKMVVDNEVAF